MWYTGTGTQFWAPSSAIRGKENINTNEVQPTLSLESWIFFTVVFIQITYNFYSAPLYRPPWTWLHKTPDYLCHTWIFSKVFAYLRMSQFKGTESVGWGCVGIFHYYFHVSISLLSFSPVLSTDFLDKKEHDLPGSTQALGLLFKAFRSSLSSYYFLLNGNYCIVKLKPF